tara:strand:- start:120 stop:989 length:870 start_codon:yes stop_codon:yes gene_type:complete
MTISLNVTDKLPNGLIEIYGHIQKASIELDIPLLIVGATARDIILVHGYGAAIERGTRDVDFGIEVQSWQHYEMLRDALIQEGFTPHPVKSHQLSTADSEAIPWEIDLIPFGGVSDADGQIAWPPKNDFAMSVLGFNEVYTHAWDVTLSENPSLVVKVASPAGILLLKLIAWTERGRETQGKDATDIYYVIRHYSRIPHVEDALYGQEHEKYMESQSYRIEYASAMKLADEVLSIIHTNTLNHLRAALLDNDAILELLTRDIAKYSHADYEEAEALVEIITARLKVGEN